MTGKILVVLLVLCALSAGAALYYLQVYHFYHEVAGPSDRPVMLAAREGGLSEPIATRGFRAIDAESSPIRYRACFVTDADLPALAARYERYENAAPRVAPHWFDCFDADAIGQEIAAGRAHVFAGQRNIVFGIDRVVAITEDGRGYVWHEVNECGDRAYDGSPLGEDCPPRD